MRECVDLKFKEKASFELQIWFCLSSYQQSRNTGHRQPLVSWQKQPSYNCKSGCEPVSIPQSFSHNRIEQVRICSRAKSQPAARASRKSLHYMEQGIIYGALLLVQGQSDKHIDFGTHEVADISAPTFHYGIIWFRWSLSSVASFRSGTSWNVGYHAFQDDICLPCSEKKLLSIERNNFCVYQHSRNCLNWFCHIGQSRSRSERFDAWFVCLVWKTAFPLFTNPHQDFVLVSNSNLLLAHSHFNNLPCNRLNYPRSQHLKILNLY